MSKFLSVSEKQIIHGLLMVVLGAILGGAIDACTAIINGTPFNFYAMLLSALVAGLAYLKKSVLSNEDGQFLKK